MGRRIEAIALAGALSLVSCTYPGQIGRFDIVDCDNTPKQSSLEFVLPRSRDIQIGAQYSPNGPVFESLGRGTLRVQPMKNDIRFVDEESDREVSLDGSGQSELITVESGIVVEFELTGVSYAVKGISAQEETLISISVLCEEPSS